MKTSIKIAAITALSFTASQALAFETEVERVGMLYLNIPLSNQTSAPKMDRSVLGFRFGQTRISTDRAGSLFTYFRSRPALIDVQFGMVGSKNAPNDIHFGLMDLKLTGISSIEKTYINGVLVTGGIAATQLLAGVAAVGGIGVMAAASGGGSSSSDNSSSQSDSSNTSDPSSINDDSESDDVAKNEIDDENEVENENEVETENEVEDDNEVETPEGTSS